ncbi:hypothetical protein NBRC111894_4710 [Sporolactobacillus inulinus]|uniref:Uncharacterized protein n=1 Tax=Sporolactobacillus inulinus TaxID=2078 RepID=A0A4Y1ZIX8_9BACL|nr:hypothetical protein NBRC111894_4710 [Sporolactobacillus inulinus]
MLWRLRDHALLMRASKTPQIPACLRRLAVPPRQASIRSVTRAQGNESKPYTEQKELSAN